MNSVNYICQACGKDQKSASCLNKHLNSCNRYPKWIKNYKKPLYVSCEKCTKEFTNDVDIQTHKEKC